jgi:pyruvate dehydrogenase E2 component (dihydrolipoamide acetyltransferase)
MPQKGLTEESAVLVLWHVKKGDTVKAGDYLFDIETGKATFSVESETSGTVLDTFGSEGEEIRVKDLVCVIGTPGETYELPAGEKPPAAPSAQAPAAPAILAAPAAKSGTRVLMPQKGLTEESAILVKWYVQAGDTVKAGDYLFDIETGKATFSVESDTAGTVLEILYAEGAEVPVGDPVCVIGDPNAASFANTAPAAQPAAKSEAGEGGRVFISPRAKALAKELNIDITGIEPTGLKNSIRAADIEAAAKNGGAQIADYKIIKHTMTRKTIARNMQKSLQTMAQFTLHSQFDASDILAARERFKANPATSGITLNDMVLHAVAQTLPKFPALNAYFEEDAIRQFNHVNLGVAVDTENGLIVPAIIKADQMRLNQISAEAKRLAKACQAGKASPEMLSGGTFTVSNLGALGITLFTPIVAPPQVAILGVGCVDYKGRMSGGVLQIYPAMQVSLTIDHRAVDGAPAAKFLKELCGKLEIYSKSFS